MACVITSPRHAIQHPSQNFMCKHIVVHLCGDAVYSFGCFVFYFMKDSSAAMLSADGGVEVLLCSHVCILSQNAAKGPTQR